MHQTVVDLHCDLLCYLAGGKQRTPYDLAPRCAIPQLRQGQVKLQTLAVFTLTGPQSSSQGQIQAQAYQKLPSQYPQEFVHFSSSYNLQSGPIGILLAFENASGFCEEHEPLNQGLQRLNKCIQDIARPLYISLTWNTENRFGGGAHAKAGLKEDGQHLLDDLHQKHIAVDLSHASDALAYDIIDYIEGNRLSIPVMASHSNARAICPMPRNLPDEIAKEIFRRQGIVGLNLYRHFIGNSEEDILNQLTHWLELGGQDYMAFGADFFFEDDLPPAYRNGKESFFKAYADASCYGPLLTFIQRELNLGPAFLDKLAHKNALSFIERVTH